MCVLKSLCFYNSTMHSAWKSEKGVIILTTQLRHVSLYMVETYMSSILGKLKCAVIKIVSCLSEKYLTIQLTALPQNPKQNLGDRINCDAHVVCFEHGNKVD